MQSYDESNPFSNYYECNINKYKELLVLSFCNIANYKIDIISKYKYVSKCYLRFS